jgi:hypothetical protein
MIIEAIDFQIKATTNFEILFRENTFSVCLVESFLRIEGKLVNWILLLLLFIEINCVVIQTVLN